MMLAMPALPGDISVLQGGAGPTVTPTPAPDANPAATDANSNAAPANSEPSTGNANSGVITNTGPTGNVSTNANANR
jgi:hypothetical protein